MVAGVRPVHAGGIHTISYMRSLLGGLETRLAQIILNYINID